MTFILESKTGKLEFKRDLKDGEKVPQLIKMLCNGLVRYFIIFTMFGIEPKFVVTYRETEPEVFFF